MRTWAALLLPLALAAQDPLAALPSFPRPAPALEAVPLATETLAPGVRMERGRRVELDGAIVIDRGPPDGLEVFACLQGGKTHETLIQLTIGQGALVKAAVLAAFGWPDGQPAKESVGVPARGVPVRLRVAWEDPVDHQPRLVDASSLVRDRITDAAYPALPWIWTGSHFETIRQAGPDGTVTAREQFMLEVTRSVAVNFDEADALIASPFPGSDTDQRFEANSRICPPVGTPVRLLIEPVALPLTLVLAADGSLRHGEVIVDDPALALLLTKAYGPGQILRAFAVRTEAGPDRTVDVAARRRLLAVAAQAKVWVVPVFTLR